MISMNSVSFSNYDSGGSSGGGSRLLDFGSGNSDAGASAPMMDPSASAAPPMDTSSMAMDPSMMMQSAPPMMDSFQPADSAAFTPPPQAAPSPSGSFDFVA